jgi:hypothetical protein
VTSLGLGRWIASKGFWYLLAVIAAYSVAWLFDLVPAPVKGMLTWIDENTTLFIIALCFCVACWAFVKVKGKKKSENVE